jgi:hypothetical protein
VAAASPSKPPPFGAERDFTPLRFLAAGEIEAYEDHAAENGGEFETHGRAHHAFDELLRKEVEEPQSDAKVNERDRDVHVGLLLYTGAAVVSTVVTDLGRFCPYAEYCCSRIEKADRAAGSRSLPAMINGRV